MAIVSTGKTIYFATIMATNRDLAHQSPNQFFPTFSLGLEFLNEADKEKSSRKGDWESVPSRFPSLSEGEM